MSGRKGSSDAPQDAKHILTLRNVTQSGSRAPSDASVMSLKKPELRLKLKNLLWKTSKSRRKVYFTDQASQI